MSAPGQPTLYIIEMVNGAQLQLYLLPAGPGPATVHMTFFDAGGRELSIAESPAVTAIPEGGEPMTFTVRRLSAGHFLADGRLTDRPTELQILADAILTDYSSGNRGRRLDPSRTQIEAQRFLNDLDRVFPGAIVTAKRNGSGRLLAHLEHWPSNPLMKGSYTCYLPGQFTTIAGNEGKSVGNLHFAGEHANSFYEWQGFMEGAVLSGLDAAAAVARPRAARPRGRQATVRASVV